MIKIDSNINEMNLKIPDANVLKDNVLNDIAEFVRADIEENLKIGKGIDGKSLRKKKRGGRLFYQTGELLRSIKKRSTNTLAEIYVESNRSIIASFLHYGTDNMVAREFFGISNKVNLKVDKYLMTTDISKLFKS